MSKDHLKWVYLLLLALIWGSSFILIKKGLVGLSALQVGSLRVVFAAVFLVIVGFKTLKKIQHEQWKWLALSGFFGEFFPAFLFSYAETEIDSGIVAILNSTTPLLAMLAGIFLFGTKPVKQKIIGVLVGLLGTTALILSGAALNPDQNYWYSGLVVLASLFYGYNANILKTHLQELPALSVTTGSFMVIAVPALVVLCTTGFFSTETFHEPELALSLLYIAILGIIGTGAAFVIFNKLIQISDPVFSTSVTYLVPIVALGWGVLDGEGFSLFQLFSGLIIILGVLIVNKSRKPKIVDNN
ncbi:MAG TPA: DMT family transporter [Salinimicrobium sp.]|nr:DMT family transporter [Salinimicrobium sp.]